MKDFRGSFEAYLKAKAIFKASKGVTFPMICLLRWKVKKNLYI